MTFDKSTKTWGFNKDVVDECVKVGWLDKAQLTDPMGAKITLESLAQQEKLFTAERLAQAQTKYRINQLRWSLVNYANQKKNYFFKDGKGAFPDTIIADSA